MPALHRLLALMLGVASAATLPAQDKPTPVALELPAEDFTPLFNGKNLDGWVNVNCHPDTFFVKDGEIVTNGKPMGFLRTAKQYENFVLEMDWMHANKTEVGNSGLFIWGDPLPATGTVYTRGIEVQVLVNLEYKNKEGKVTASSHGDVFAIWGAKCVPDRPHPGGGMRCIPSEYRAKGGGEWNHYKVTANDGVIKLEVNGKEVSGVSKCNPRKGYLALESEGAECHFKNIRIKELPSTNPKPEEIAKVWEGHKSIFNGLDLKGWTGATDRWKVVGSVMRPADGGELFTAKKFGSFELVFDWRVPPRRAVTDGGRVGVLYSGASTFLDLDGVTAVNDGTIGWDNAKTEYELKTPLKPGTWTRSVVRFDGTALTITTNDVQWHRATTKEPRPDAILGFSPGAGLEITNVFVRELKEKK